MNNLLMYETNYTGKLITFCGLDGCGKSTMISLLSDYLKDQGLQVLLTKQPTDFARKSDIFRNYMDNPNHEQYEYRSLSLMAASDRVQHSNKLIVPALSEGKTVISDRYFYSCLANLRARGYKNDNWIYEISSFIPKPYISFFLDVEVKTAIDRVTSRVTEKDRFIDIGLQYKLRKEYLNIASINQGIVVSTEIDIEKSFITIKNIVDEYLLNGDVRDDSNERII